MARTHGHSLIEVVLSIAILGLAIVAVLSLLPTSGLAVRKAERQTAASRVAQSVLESKAAGPFSGLMVGEVVELEPRPGPGGVTYQSILGVYAVSGSDPEVLKEVRVVVRWSEGRQVHRLTHSLYVDRIPR